MQSAYVSRYNSPFNTGGLVANECRSDFISGHYSSHVTKFIQNKNHLEWLNSTRQVHRQAVANSRKSLGIDIHNPATCRICKGQ